MAINNKSGNAYVTVSDLESASPAGGSYVPLIGGTMTGDLKIKKNGARLKICTPEYQDLYGVILESNYAFGGEVNFYGGYGFANFLSVKSVGAESSQLGNLFLSPNGRRTTIGGPLSSGPAYIGQGTNGTMCINAANGIGRIACDSDTYGAIQILGDWYGNAKGNVGIGTVSSQFKFYNGGRTAIYVETYPCMELGSDSAECSIYMKPYGGDTSHSMWAMGPGAWGLTNSFGIGVYSGPPGGSICKMEITNNGVVITTGNQSIYSDKSLKTNIKPVEYTVDDIAGAPAVTFEWKDGSGRSAGSIAQYWKPIIPELVNRIDEKMTLAYGQLGTINSIIDAKEAIRIDDELKEIERKNNEMEKKLNALKKEFEELVQLINS